MKAATCQHDWHRNPVGHFHCARCDTTLIDAPPVAYGVPEDGGVSDLVEIGAEGMLDTDLGKMILARHEAKTLLRGALTAIEKAGHRIVPVEPTEEMLAVYADAGVARAHWSSMLAAAPKVI